MYHYQPDSEMPTERLLLIELTPSQYGGEHRHIHARVVRRSQKTYTDPDSQRIVYGDSDDTGYRNTTWLSGKPGALFVEDFVMTSQMTVREYNGAKGERKLYGIKREFKPYSVDSRLCQHMAKTFAKVDRDWAKQDAALGYLRDDDFAGNARRLMGIFGIKKFLVYKPGKSGDLGTPDNFTEGRPLEIEYHIEKMMDSVYGAKE